MDDIQGQSISFAGAAASAGGGGDQANGSDAGFRPREERIDPRVRAVSLAGRYYGMELDEGDFRRTAGETHASAASLAAWAQECGLWAKGVRLNWRQLLRIQAAGPVVLLFTDGSAGLMTAANAESRVVMIKDPLSPVSEPAVVVDENRLRQVWSGEAVLVRVNRGIAAADAPFNRSWLVSLVGQERRSLRDIAYASLTLSFLTIFPPLLVMTAVDKVLTHHSYSTLALLATILAIGVVYETLLGHARRMIVLTVGTRLDTKLNLHIFARLLRLPLDYFERHPAGETMHKLDQVNKVREFLTGKLLTTFLDMFTLLRAAAVPVLPEHHARLDRRGLRRR